MQNPSAFLAKSFYKQMIGFEKAVSKVLYMYKRIPTEIYSREICIFYPFKDIENELMWAGWGTMFKDSENPKILHVVLFEKKE